MAQEKDTMHVMFINNEGEGFAKKVEIEEGTYHLIVTGKHRIRLR